MDYDEDPKTEFQRFIRLTREGMHTFRICYLFIYIL